MLLSPPPLIGPVGGGNGYTLTFTPCWWWKGYTLTCTPCCWKGYTLTFTPCWWWKWIHPHVHILLVGGTDTPSRVHPAVERDTPPRSHPAGGGNRYTLTFTSCWWWKLIQPHVYTLLLKGIHPHVHTLLVVEMDTPSRSHPAGGGNGYTLTFTPCWWWKWIHPYAHILLVVERDTSSRSHPAGGGRNTPSRSHPAVDGKGFTLTFTPCWWWKGYTLTFTPCWWWKGYTLTLTPCWWWKRIHPHAHTLPVVEKDTPSRSHPAVDRKGYTLTFTPCWWWKGIHPHVHTLLLVETYLYNLRSKCWNSRNAGNKLDRHRHFHRYSSESVRCLYSGIRVTPLPLVTDY